MANACGGDFQLRRDGLVHCTYCGSLTVQEAINALKKPGTRFSGSDWKYGYPHKFYIEPPNPNADEIVEIGSKSGPDVDARAGSGPNDHWICKAHYKNPCGCPREINVTGHWSESIMGTQKSIFGKFYVKHLKDATEEQFAEFSVMSERIFGIRFTKDSEGKLMYVAPQARSIYGYQRAGTIGENGEPKHTL